VAADPGALERDTHLLEQRVAAGEFDGRRARTWHERVSDGIHGAPRYSEFWKFSQNN
jgi:hypothetical protein